eukprot:9335364-Alexandrium_andersonii.AAC.1
MASLLKQRLRASAQQRSPVPPAGHDHPPGLAHRSAARCQPSAARRGGRACSPSAGGSRASPTPPP